MTGVVMHQDPDVRTYLALSTAHVSRDTAEKLDADDQRGDLEMVCFDRIDNGWLVWVPDDPIESRNVMEPDVPLDILMVQIYARKLGCDYVKFDADGPTVSDLPRWEW